MQGVHVDIANEELLLCTLQVAQGRVEPLAGGVGIEQRSNVLDNFLGEEHGFHERNHGRPGMASSCGCVSSMREQDPRGLEGTGRCSPGSQSK